jgi:hypothetical protein
MTGIGQEDGRSGGVNILGERTILGEKESMIWHYL